MPRSHDWISAATVKRHLIVGDAVDSIARDQSDRVNAEHATLLNLLLFSLGKAHHEVPSDLAARLQEFVPAPTDS
jgi:hypothetical protein